MPMMEAPLYVPAEARRHGGGPGAPRWFRLAIAVSEDSVRLRSPLPEELREGPLDLLFHLPEDRDPAAAGDPRAPDTPGGAIAVTGTAGEVIVDEGQETEHAELRLVYLHGVPEAVRTRIRHYVQLRLDSGAPPA